MYFRTHLLDFFLILGSYDSPKRVRCIKGIFISIVAYALQLDFIVFIVLLYLAGLDIDHKGLDAYINPLRI